jgi:hypothetical protein
MDKNFWNLRVNERLTQWKDFRGELSNLPLDKAIQQVNDIWSTAGYVNFYLAPDNPTDWPDPWSLIAENYYCDIAKALGIIYTIYFTAHRDIEPELRIYYDFNTKNRYNVAYISQGKYILNYWPYEIVNTEQLEKQQLQLLYQYSSKELQLEKY